MSHACHRPRWFLVGLVLGSAVLGGLWAAVDARRLPPPLDPEVAEQLRQEGFEEGKLVAQATIREVLVEVPGPERVRVVEVVRGGITPSDIPPPEVTPPAAGQPPGPPLPEHCPICPVAVECPEGFYGLRPEDLGGDCQAEIVEDGGRRWARLWLTARARQWPLWQSEAVDVTRGPELAGEVEFQLDRETHARRPRWRATLLAGVTTVPGWTVGLSWQGCSRWGVQGALEGDFEKQEDSFSYFDSPNETFISESLSTDRYRLVGAVTFTLGSRPAGCYR